MPRKRYTVLIIPDGSHKVRRFSLRPGLLWLSGFLAVAAGVVVTVLLYDYSQVSSERAELLRLRSENRCQQTDIRTLASQLECVQKELVILAQNDAKVRLIAEMAVPKKSTQAGIGGQVDEDVPNDLSLLQKQIDEVRQAIDLRRVSQVEIQGFLNDQRSLMAAKPQGWPARGWLSSVFGMRKSPFTGRRKMHEGLDIAARTGAPIFATADGIVSRVETQAGYGKVVYVEHGYGYTTLYGHNSKIFVKVGQRVKRGEKISAMGNTGQSTGPHLHYEVRLNGVPLNPKKFL